jgi:hypothetical protein
MLVTSFFGGAIMLALEAALLIGGLICLSRARNPILLAPAAALLPMSVLLPMALAPHLPSWTNDVSEVLGATSLAGTVATFVLFKWHSLKRLWHSIASSFAGREIQ